MTYPEISRRTALMMGGMPVLLALPVRAQTSAAVPAFAGRAQTIRLGAFQVTTLLGGESMRDKPIETFGIGVDPAEIWRARLVAASVSSNRLGILSRQSSIVMRAIVVTSSCP